MRKQCRKCLRKLDTNKFFRLKRSLDGLGSYCKLCSLACKKASLKKKPDYYRRKGLEQNKSYAKRNREKVLQWKRDEYYRNIKKRPPRNRPYNRDKAMYYHKKYHYKNQARRAVAGAIRNGKLKRPKKCEICNSREKIGRNGQSLLYADHYKGYDKKNWLNVRFICRPCDAITMRKYVRS